MDNKLLLLLVAIPVILAGCIGQTPGVKVGVGNGLIITSFSPELPEVDSGDDLLFSIIVKNVGDVTVAASNAQIDISGLDDWTGTMKDINIDIDLRRADPTRGEEGGEILKDTTLTAPTKTVSVAYTPTARLSYKYSTTSTIQLKYATRELVRSDPSQQSTATVTTSAGPFVVSVRGKLPVIQSGSSIAVPLQLEIQNVGGGRAFSSTDLTVGSDEIDKLDIPSITMPTDTTLTCSPTLPLTGHRLIGGKSRILSCTLTFSSVPAAGFATTSFDLVLDYYYFVDTQTSVTVLKPL